MIEKTEKKSEMYHSREHIICHNNIYHRHNSFDLQTNGIDSV